MKNAILSLIKWLTTPITKAFNTFKLRIKVYIVEQVEQTKQQFYLITGISAYNRKGATTSDILVVVYIVVAFLVAAILFPIAMVQVTSASTASWNAAVSTVFVVLLPIFTVLAIALHLLGLF